MSKLATLRLLDGDLKQGVQVLLTIATLQSSGETSQGFETEHPFSGSEISGALPPNICLASTIEQWQTSYQCLDAMRMQVNQVTYDASIHQDRLKKCKELEAELRLQFNRWLLSESFRPIRDKWLKELMRDEVRVLIRTANKVLVKLPWQLWDSVEQNSLVEVAFSIPDAEAISNAKTPTLQSHLKILAILGDGRGIDIDRDRQLLECQPDGETTFLVEPSRQEINDHLQHFR